MSSRRDFYTQERRIWINREQKKIEPVSIPVKRSVENLYQFTQSLGKNYKQVRVQ